MAKSVPLQTGFVGGKIGRRLRGRTDLARYQYACEDLQNFLVTVQGAALKRSGTRFVKPCIDDGTVSRLIPFEVSETQSYVLELTEGAMRFYRNNGAVLETAQAMTAAPTAANPVVVNVTGHGLTSGDQVFIEGSAMTELNGRFYTITVLGANDFELRGEDGTGRTTGAGGTVAAVYQIDHGVSSNDIPWTQLELDDIQFVQNEDLMYLVHPNHPVHLLTRLGDTNWTLTELTFAYPAFEKENTTGTTVIVGNGTVGANTTLTASASLFTANDVGRSFTVGEVMEAANGLWQAGITAPSDIIRNGSFVVGAQLYYEGRLYQFSTGGNGTRTGYSPLTHEEGEESDGVSGYTFLNWGGYGYATITGFNNSTSVNATVVLEFSDNVCSANGTASDKWAYSAWDEVNGYPSAVAFYENRLWLAGTRNEPQTLWGSVTGEFDNFRIKPADKDDTGLQFRMLSDKRNQVEWMQGDEVLFVGTTGGEFTVDSGSANQGITPSNVRVRRRSNYGTDSDVQPITIDSSLIFVRRSTDVHELTFSFDTDRYVAPDLTQYSHDILRPGVTLIDYQADPFRQLWARKTDGTLAALTFIKLEDVIAWSDVVVGGTAAEVESIAVIPHPDGDEDQLWMIVKRTVNGVTRRWVEYLEKPFNEDDAIADAFFVDAGLTYSGSPTAVVTGLQHLEGETVQIVADGAVLPQQTVSSGQVTLSSAASKVHVGLPMGSSKLRTVKWAGDSPGGTAPVKPQRVVGVSVRVDRMGEGLEYGADFTTMDTWDLRKPSDPMDAPVPLYTGDSPILDMPSGWDQSRQVALRHDVPLPCTILSIAGKTEVEML